MKAISKKTLLVAFVALMSASASFAQSSTKIKDVRTNPDLYFLQDGEQPSSLDLLPPPPETGSLQWFNDESRYYWGLKQRNTERGDQAAADANVEDVAHNFSEAFGVSITKEGTPNIYKLVYKMLATWLLVVRKNITTEYVLSSITTLLPATLNRKANCPPTVPTLLATPLSVGQRHWYSQKSIQTARTKF